MSSITLSTALEKLDRDELLATVRRLLVEADSLSSRISAVNEIGIAMNRTLDLATIQRVVAKQAKWLLDYNHLDVVLKGPTGWHVTTLFGPSEPTTFDFDQSPDIARLLQTGQPQLIHNGSPSAFLANYKSQLLVTLAADNVVLGSINFAATKPNLYTQDDMRIAYMLSLQLSSAIRNAKIFMELEQTQEQLKVTVEELDAYGHTIAHDLKTPLSNVMLWSDLFKKMYSDKIPPDSLRYIDTIHDSGRVMNRMIDQLLSLAKLRHTPQNLGNVSVARAVDSALLRFSHQLDEHNIQAVVGADIPDALGHEQWIEEIFANLISNAIKYMGDDNPMRRINISGMLQGDKVRYEVRDTGVGINPEDQARLFEKFTRLHNANTKVEGLGLGLSIVLRMVKKMNGEVGIESVVGEGSTFWFTLPFAPKTEPSKIKPVLNAITAVEGSLTTVATETVVSTSDLNVSTVTQDLAPTDDTKSVSEIVSPKNREHGSEAPEPSHRPIVAKSDSTVSTLTPGGTQVELGTAKLKTKDLKAKIERAKSKLALNASGFQPVPAKASKAGNTRWRRNP